MSLDRYTTQELIDELAMREQLRILREQDNNHIGKYFFGDSLGCAFNRDYPTMENIKQAANDVIKLSGRTRINEEDYFTYIQKDGTVWYCSANYKLYNGRKTLEWILRTEEEALAHYGIY